MEDSKVNSNPCIDTEAPAPLPAFADAAPDSQEQLCDASSSTKRRPASARVVVPATDDVGPGDDSEDDSVEEAIDDEDTDFLGDFPDDTEELELVHARITSLDRLRLHRFAGHLKKLCLRQNHITQLDPDVFSLLTKLEELDLYDNKVKTPDDALESLCNLSVLDLSFNLLRAVPDTLGRLKALQTVYFVQNRISKISGFDYAVTLRSLELGGNKIRKIENLDALVNLEELWLGKNKIAKLENLSTLKRLKILALQSNRVTKIEGLEGLENLQELYLSHNGVTKLEGLDANVTLKTLDAGNNFIRAIENIKHLTALEELWMNGNQIPDLQALVDQLGSTLTLETLYLEGNPCQTSDQAYRRKIKLYLPQLKQIDATLARVP